MSFFNFNYLYGQNNPSFSNIKGFAKINQNDENGMQVGYWIEGLLESETLFLYSGTYGINKVVKPYHVEHFNNPQKGTICKNKKQLVFGSYSEKEGFLVMSALDGIWLFQDTTFKKTYTEEYWEKGYLTNVKSFGPYGREDYKIEVSIRNDSTEYSYYSDSAIVYKKVLLVKNSLISTLFYPNSELIISDCEPIFEDLEYHKFQQKKIKIESRSNKPMHLHCINKKNCTLNTNADSKNTVFDCTLLPLETKTIYLSCSSDPLEFSKSLDPKKMAGSNRLEITTDCATQQKICIYPTLHFIYRSPKDTGKIEELNLNDSVMVIKANDYNSNVEVNEGDFFNEEGGRIPGFNTGEVNKYYILPLNKGISKVDISIDGCSGTSHLKAVIKK